MSETLLSVHVDEVPKTSFFANFEEFGIYCGIITEKFSKKLKFGYKARKWARHYRELKDRHSHPFAYMRR